MGVYAHRFIEVIDKDNQWHLLPLWSKYKDSSYNQPDLVADDLKLTKHHCFLRRSSSGFYSPGSMYSVDDISHSIAQFLHTLVDANGESLNELENFFHALGIPYESIFTPEALDGINSFGQQYHEYYEEQEKSFKQFNVRFCKKTSNRKRKRKE